MDTFWKWMARGSGGTAGYRNVVNAWLIFHFSISAILCALLPADGFTFSKSALFPAASILVGMSLAWTTRASTILQSEDLRKRLFSADRPAEDYVYGYQLAILIIIMMVAYTAIMAGGGLSIAVFGAPLDQDISTFWMFVLMSMALRECWGAVNFTNLLSLLEYRRSAHSKVKGKQ